MVREKLGEFWQKNYSLVLGDLCFIIAILSVVLQAVLKLEPCVLCMIQRVAYVTLGLGFFFIYFSHKLRVLKPIAAIVLTVSFSTGIAATIRQLWLQSLPANARASCMPSLDYMIKMVGYGEAVRRYIFEGGHGCGHVKYKIFGLTIAHVSLIGFIGILIIFALTCGGF